MHLFALHLKNFGAQLIDKNLFFVHILLKLLHSFHFVDSHVCSFPFLCNLSFKSWLHLFFFLLLRGNQDLVARNLFLHLIYLIIWNYEFAVGFALAFLNLIYVLLELDNDISKLLILLGKLVLHSLKPDFVDVLILCGNFLHLRGI